MASSIFLNFEKISLQIIEDEISKMTDDNMSKDDDNGCSDMVDIAEFTKNLYHGSTVAIFIVNLYETALNTILCKRLECSEEEILKTSHSVKLQLICKMYNVELSEIKSDISYATFQKINKLRNDITHYKNNELKMGSYISNETKISLGTSKDALAEMFTKTYMNNCYEGVLSLLNLICEKCGLVINPKCGVIDCDARDCLCEFIVTKETFESSVRYLDYEAPNDLTEV